jgi:hypothetical protein
VTDPPPIVLVEWVDATGLESGDWMREDEIAASLELDAIRHESVGYLVGESEHAIALAGSRSLYPEEHVTKFGSVATIPRAAILRGPVVLVEAPSRRARAPRRRRPREQSPA